MTGLSKGETGGEKGKGMYKGKAGVKGKSKLEKGKLKGVMKGALKGVLKGKGKVEAGKGKAETPAPSPTPPPEIIQDTQLDTPADTPAETPSEWPSALPTDTPPPTTPARTTPATSPQASEGEGGGKSGSGKGGGGTAFDNLTPQTTPSNGNQSVVTPRRMACFVVYHIFHMVIDVVICIYMQRLTCVHVYYQRFIYYDLLMTERLLIKTATALRPDAMKRSFTAVSMVSDGAGPQPMEPVADGDQNGRVRRAHVLKSDVFKSHKVGSIYFVTFPRGQAPTSWC